jgi:hypothetical protein
MHEEISERLQKRGKYVKKRKRCRERKKSKEKNVYVYGKEKEKKRKKEKEKRKRKSQKGMRDESSEDLMKCKEECHVVVKETNLLFFQPCAIQE